MRSYHEPAPACASSIAAQSFDLDGMAQHILGVILARGGSQGLPRKNALPLASRPVIEWTIRAARDARLLDDICLTSDMPAALQSARDYDLAIIERPADLATHQAAVDATVRHAVETYEREHASPTHIAILYGNVPVRPDGVIDRAIECVLRTGADSVRSMSPVGKFHPDWMHRMDGDRLTPLRENSIHRRQDLEPLFYHDGAVVVVTRAALFTAAIDDPHAFFGTDRRGVLSNGYVVDIDTEMDLRLAEAILNARCVETAEALSAGANR